RRAYVGLWRALIKARNPTLVYEPLATLGGAIALGRYSSSATGLVRGQFDVGPYEIEELVIDEVDATGRQRHGESFTADHLGDAVVRLYQRYAELLPEGPGRQRAAATARTVAKLLGPFDFDR